MQQKASFREHFWRTASVYRSKYRSYTCRGSLLSKQVKDDRKKLFEIDFNIINIFSNFIRDFRLVAIVVVDKTRKRGIYASLVPELQS